MADLHENPLGTDGFEFVEYAHPEPEKLRDLLKNMGFSTVARHKHKNVTLHRQGDINFIINAEPDSFAQRFARQHGPSVCAMAFRVKDAAKAYKLALQRGAVAVPSEAGPMELNIPAIEGIGGSRIYLVDMYGKGRSIYDIDFEPLEMPDNIPSAGLTYIDHLTHNVWQGQMQEWSGFYERIFNFREIRYFDIEGNLTGLISQAMTSPCGKIRIPINESRDDKSQIMEFIHKYRGEGIQHIALGSEDIYKSVEMLRKNGIAFMSTPDSYYDRVDERLPGHGENLDRLRQSRILVDGAPTEGQGLLLQIFTQEVIGPIFYEIIQRKGNEGFGEGNFKALFVSMEDDQIRRGVLKA